MTTFTGDAGNNTLPPAGEDVSGDDEFFGLGGNDTVDAGLGNDSLDGGEGNDLLRGDFGDDTMRGGLGNDTFRVDDLGDVVIEKANEGIDTINTTISLALIVNVENLRLIGTDDINGVGTGIANVITGNSGDNILNGGLGADSLIGGLGDDTFVVDNVGDKVTEAAGGGLDLVRSFITTTLAAGVEKLLLAGADLINGTGNDLANELTGNGAANLLDGAGGADTMAGGTGDDIYHINAADDVVIEFLGEGVDTIRTTIGRTLDAQVEILELVGTARIDGAGNDLDNLLIGNVTKNSLYGGFGLDTLRGGLGNDEYIIDAPGDVIFEKFNEGTDYVVSSVSLTLAANVENLELTSDGDRNGSGNKLDNKIKGANGDNLLRGLDGNDTLEGRLGNDTLIGGLGDDVLDASASFDGSDALEGGLGDDLYILWAGQDTAAELAGEGTDTLRALGFHGTTATLSANIENLELLNSGLSSGPGNVNGIGNALDNVITGNDGSNILDGGIGADTLAGGFSGDTYVIDAADTVIEIAGDPFVRDTIRSSFAMVLIDNVENLELMGNSNITGAGNDADNIIIGNTGHNFLAGGAGSDTLKGGLGNDRYRVEDAGDRVVEEWASGIDTVLSAVSLTLSANLENLEFASEAAITGTGNDLANKIVGQGRGNVLDGRLGNDTLTGNAGEDIFAFSTTLNAASNVDIVTDFSVADDTVRLAQSVFSTLGAGTLAADAFVIGAAAADASDRIVYDDATGALLYDKDGTGAAAAVQFATLGAGLELTNADFLVG